MFESKRTVKSKGDWQRSAKGAGAYRKILNSGLTGFASKAFLGKDFMNNMNDMLAKGQDAIDMQKSAQNIAQTGMPATAE